jgi:AcrR family transcriptional regulator
LLEATRRVLAREGLDGISTTRIAAEAGVSVGTVYQYFPTKEALAAAFEEALLTEMQGMLMTRIQEVTETLPPGSPLDAATKYRIGRAVIDALARSARMYRFEPGEMQLVARSSRKLAIAEQAAEALGAVFDAIQANIFPIHRHRAALMVVTTAVQMSFWWAAEHPDDVDSGHFQDELGTMFARYVTRDVDEHPFA